MRPIQSNSTGALVVPTNSLEFDQPQVTHTAAIYELDSWDATQYRLARYAIITENDLDQIEYNDLVVIHDTSGAFARSVSTLNNISTNTYICQFSVELVRSRVYLFVTSVAQRNHTRFHRVLTLR
jgi:hypothetical protein